MPLNELRRLITSSYQENEYPVAISQANEWSETRPLAGLKILDATPVFRNTITKYISLLEAGAELCVGISDVMPRDEKIVEFLKSVGICVHTPENAPNDLDLVLDCAAAFANVPARIGYVELTRSGVEKYSGSTKPVFVADSGKIKRIETCLGTGESYYRAMKQLGYTEWQDRKVVVFGSGKVGTGLITYAHKMGASVHVVTRLQDASELVKSIATEVISCDDSAKIAEAVSDAYAVVTATGVADAMKGKFPPEALINSPALIANMGVEDEFGCEIPAERVLLGKKTLNFILEEPTLIKYIDATMALHNAGALYLATNPGISGVINPPEELEEQLLDVCRKNGTIADELDWIL